MAEPNIDASLPVGEVATETLLLLFAASAAAVSLYHFLSMYFLRMNSFSSYVSAPVGMRSLSA